MRHRARQCEWAVQMATVEFHPWNSRRADVERPDEWRIDLDPMPEASFEAVCRVAGVAREVLDEIGAVGWPKTSGGNGLHIYVRIEPRWGFGEVREAALAFAREVERRIPADATTTWWRKDRDPRKVFVDYNQNARDHTIASAYSRSAASAKGPCRRRSGGRGVDDVDPREYTIATVPARFAPLGDLHAGIDDAVFSLEPLLEWAARDDEADEVDSEPCGVWTISTSQCAWCDTASPTWRRTGGARPRARGRRRSCRRPAPRRATDGVRRLADRALIVGLDSLAFEIRARRFKLLGMLLGRVGRVDRTG